MSRIRRLSIRGIRNFGDDKEESAIRFSRPLTLILGPNGTGKTTIIEALKYATIGEFPPGSDKGKSFIHDPALSTTFSVRGVVKAEIIDNSGNCYTISRTIEGSKAHLALKFRTVDSTLSRLAKGSKQTVSITHRCSNVDTEIPLIMGVSKPILNYVIFCHQEDFNWPFQEGKKLKEKFDEIFDSVRFNKALENIMKFSKELREEVRVTKVQKEGYYAIVTEVQSKEKKLEENKRRLENSKLRVKEITEEMQPVAQKIRKIEKIDSDYKNTLAEEERKKAEYNLSKEQVARLKECIQEIFNGSLEELHAQIESYDDTLLKKTGEIKEYEIRLRDINEEESRVTNMLAEERVNVGTLKQQIKDHDRKISLRNRMLNETLSAWNLKNVDSNVTELEVLALTKRIAEKVRELDYRITENRVKMEEEEKELQKEVDTLRIAHSKIESEQNLKENEILEARQENNRLQSEISQLGTAANKLNSIEIKIEEAKNKIDKLNKEMDIETIKQEIHAKIILRDETEARLNKVDEEISSLLKQSSLQAELELHKSTLLSKEKEMEKLKDKHEDKIKVLMDIKDISKTKLKDKLDNIQQKLVDEVKCITQRIQTEERRSTALETTISHTEREIKKMENEIESGKKKISAICHYKDFEETLLLQSKKVKDLQDKRGMYAHQGAAYKEYMNQLKNNNPCCPLCHRGFTDRESVVNLLKEMENEVENHPNRLKQYEKELKIQQEKYDMMLQLKSVVEKVIQLEETELQKLKNNLEETKKKLIQSRVSLKELGTQKNDPETKLATHKGIISDIIIWDRCIDDISKANQMIDKFQNRMNTEGIKTERTLEAAQTEREALKITLKNKRDEIEDLQAKITIQSEKIQDAREAQNALHEEQLRLRSGMQKLKQLKDKEEELYSREISLVKAVNVLREKLSAAELELNAAAHKLKMKKKQNSEKQVTERNLAADGERRLSELEKVQDEVDLFVDRNIPEALQHSEVKIDSYQSSITALLSEKKNIEEVIAKQKEKITRQQVRKRELTDNLLLRKAEDAANALQQECVVLSAKLRAIAHDQVIEEWERLQSREEALMREKNIAKGHQEELERSVQQFIQDLRKEEYRQARKNYKKKCIELTVQEEVILNLRAYCKVLDKAMIEYHEERIATVNKIMKQMWKLVYTGTDTTSIEIRTDATEGVGGKKRTYNYKLVQTKHGHEMDMKGRCSAGQKVLASIILRLALAETFCKDCGILALDEPTTNLDEENANSLATALATVVKLRSQHQKNFQLIVISHDEKFLFKLADLNSNKGFYELYRKNNGYTAIRHCQVGAQDNFVPDAIKEEVSSDEGTSKQPTKSRNKHQSEETSEESARSDTSSRKKRYALEDDDEDRDEGRPSKRRYVFNM